MRKTFKWKDYSVEGPDRYKVMTLAMDEFIPRQKNIHSAQRGRARAAT